MTPNTTTENSVEVAMIRRLVEESEMTPTDLAKAFSWYNARGHADSTRVKRMLGLLAHQSAGKRYFNRRMTHKNALMFAEALKLDPHELGL